MANEIATTAAPQLPAALAAIKSSIQNTVQRLPASGGTGFLQFSKYGEWLLGQSGEVVHPKDHFAVNVLGVKTGYICWPSDDKARKNGPLGTVAVPLGQNVDPASLDRSLAGVWTDYVEVPVRFVGGELDGEEAVYNTNSRGGVDAVRGLLNTIVDRLSNGNADFYPVVSAQADSYQHKTYGKTFFPVLDITGWVDQNGQAAAAKAAATAPAQEAAPAADAASDAASEQPAEEPAAGGRRRRRA